MTRKRRASRRRQRKDSNHRRDRTAEPLRQLLTIPLPGADPHAEDDCPICKAFGIDPSTPGGSVIPITSEEDLLVLTALMEHANRDDPARS